MENAPAARLLKGPEVTARTGLSRITLWRKSRDGEFPAPRRTVGRRIAWLEADVEAWINGRPLSRDQRVG